MSSYDPFENYLRTISTKPRRMADTPVTQDQQDRFDELLGDPRDAIRGIEITAAKEARAAAAYAMRRKYKAEEGDPSDSWKKPLPKPRIPYDPKYANMPTTSELEDRRQMYQSPFMDKQMYDFLDSLQTGSVPDPGEDALPPGILEQQLGSRDFNWNNAYRQMGYKGRAPDYPPREIPLSPQQYETMMQGADDPREWPKPTAPEVDG